jgi:hypothetical protein
VPERLTGENVREMQFDDRLVEDRQRIEQGDRGMRERAGVVASIPARVSLP